MNVEDKLHNEARLNEAWRQFWNLPEVKAMPCDLYYTIARFVDEPDFQFGPPIVGFSQENQCFIVAWVDLGDAVFDIAYFLDGKAGWYFRDGVEVNNKHSDPPGYVTWGEVPTLPLERFKVCLEVSNATA